MNRIYYLATLATLALAGCASMDDMFRLDDYSKSSDRRSETKLYQVSLRSATYFAQKLQLEDGVSRQVKSIEPIISGQDTLLYFVNYAKDQGWVVLSGDKRTEAILASSTTGNLNKDALGGSAVWFDDLAGKIYGIKRSNTKAPQSNDYTMWCKIDTLILGLRPESGKPRLLGPDEPNVPNEDDYENILVDVEIRVLVDKKVGPLIQTKWGQSSPWNECTPFWRDSWKRCPPGCVAVAGAQMLYYFHYLKNKPRNFYSSGGCEGVVWNKTNRSYRFSFYEPREDVWDKMDRWASEPTDIPALAEGTYLASLLMGFVGSQVDMDYGIEGSGADFSKLVKLYRDLGIRSSLTDYKEELVRASLDQQLPVNVSAAAAKKTVKIFSIPIWWTYDAGHAWIIDGYKDKRILHTATYDRVPKLKKGDEDVELRSNRTVQQEAAQHPSPLRYRPTVRFSVKTTEVSYYWKMNFGWGGSCDDADFLTEGDNAWDTGDLSFRYRRRIIHNFSF